MNQNETIFEKQDIFKKRENILPYEYPELLEYKKAIRHSYWLESEFNFTSDINDFKIKVNDSEREAIKRTMLAERLVNDKDFYEECSKRAKENYSKYYNAEVFKQKINSILI